MWGQLPIVVFGSRGSVGMGNGSTASPEVGDGQWVQCFPKEGDGQWLHCFPEVGDGLWLPCFAKVWIGEGAPPAVCIECRMVPSYMLVDKDGGWF